MDGKAKDGGDAGVGEQVDNSAHKETAKVKENPFWFEDIIKDAEQHYNHPENVQHHHHHHSKRAKRNHRKRTKAMRHVDTDRILAKRSLDYQEDDYPQDEVFSASEVIGNIFNENDTSSNRYEGGRENGELTRCNEGKFTDGLGLKFHSFQFLCVFILILTFFLFSQNFSAIFFKIYI